ncbi:MAG TPA: IS21 family transposase, partial [Rhodanobacteraceae bacterium]|nr:IS21 family transposase [Rhodanobacteraceae bacterium]
EVEPRYPKRKSPSKLDPYAAELTEWLRSNAASSRKQRHTAGQMYAALRAKGYPGSYGRVAAFARDWRRGEQERLRTAGRGTFVPLAFAPGEAFQFDWSEDAAVIGGERIKLQIAQFKLCHSRAFLLRAYPLQTHEMLFDAHAHAFAVFGGVPRRGIFDNMKTAVDRIPGRGKSRQVNARFAAMVSHYLFEAEFCNPASGWEKGQIEKNVQDSRHRVWPDVPACSDLAALNNWLERRCIELWQTLPHPERPQRTIAEVWREEQPHLMVMPVPFDGFVEQTKRVTPTCLVHVERNRYSVPASFANRPVSVRLYAECVVFAAEGQVIAEHRRRINRRHDGGQTIYDWRHYLSVVQRKPGALRNGAPFAELPEGFRRLQTILLRRPGGDREMVEILALVLQYDEQAVLAAVELALEANVPSKPHVLNLLARLTGETLPAPLAAPPALVLKVEPVANVARYDTLRRVRHVA